MAGRVAIVTDSTAALPHDWAMRLGVTVVPLRLRIGDTEIDEDRTTPERLVSALRGQVPVSTTPPPTPAFYWAYRDAMARGAQAIVSVHISSRLSKTCEAAQAAAEQVPIPVHVVDSRWSGMVLGYAALAGAEAALAGASPERVLEIVRWRCQYGHVTMYVDTLEYLRRGGRIGRAQALLGTALAIKPLLSLENGQIVPVDKVRGSNRALNRLEEITLKHAGNRAVDLAVEYLDTPDRAAALAQRLRAKLPSVRMAHLGIASKVIAAHLGPGAIGVTVSPVGW